MPSLRQQVNKYLQFVEVFFPKLKTRPPVMIIFPAGGRSWEDNVKRMSVHTCVHTEIFLPGLRPSSRIRSGLQAQNLCENFVMRVSRYSPRSSGA